MSKRIVKTWSDVPYASSVDAHVNSYAEENNLELISVSLAVGVRHLHVSAVFECQEEPS